MRTRLWWALAAGLLVACTAPAVAPTSGPTDTSSPATGPTTAVTSPSTPTSRAADPVATTPPGLLGRVWTTVPTTRRRVALTFDCGGNADGLPSILATLRAKRVRAATFFVTGSWARAFPAEAAQLGALGYVVGNHTNHHLRLTDLDDATVRREVRQGRLAVRAATGVEPKRWFRFPFGAYDTRTLGLVAASGWVVVGWTVDTLGWQGTSGGQSAETVVARVLAAARPGEIVLMHVGSNPDDGTTLDADALAAVIDSLRALGYRFFTPTAML